MVALGAVIATLLGFALFYGLKGKKKSIDSSMKSSENRICKSDSGKSTDIIIVGAGVAGSALAYTLGKDGRRVHVIERDLRQPDRIVGELLQPGGYLKLVELDCVSDIDAQNVYGYALYKDGKSTKLSYPLGSFNSNVAGRSFHHGRFVQRMREKAASLPNVRMEQGTVTSLLERNGTIKGVEYKTKTGEKHTAYAPLTVVCDGCCSNLRRNLCNPKVEIPSCFVGLALENCIIPHELQTAFISATEKGNMRTMPNRNMPAAPYPTPGALLMGDAFNMRHPLTGGGMTVALSDVILLRDLLRPLHSLDNAYSLCKYFESFYTLRKPVASTINTLAGALYKVFSASSDPAREEIRQACFDYLRLGGVFSSGPISILSGLNPRPLGLVLHFFTVAVYGVGRLLIPFPSPKRLWIGARLISDASGIIFPIIKAEGITQMFFPVAVPAYYRAPPVKGIQIALAPPILYEDLTAFIEKLVSLTDLIGCKSEDHELNTNIASPLSPSLELKNEANDSPAPPRFPPKSNLEVASDFGHEDNLTVAEAYRCRFIKETCE
ncbi:Squalene monooxygenase [Citrus sinensis]|uniref:Squalene monooxygenase n=1 Tax=Citrus sinensis TaxID=2711 RepID=A0ACB8NGV5_CITSI|nr:Squalene monooxygenase [Citrus sinensis]